MREESQFDRLAGLTPEDRRAELDRFAAADPVLHARLVALLAADDRTCPLDRPAVASADLRAGAVVAGRYVLTRKLGEGGMGAVWAADQTDPVRRAVAVKFIRPGRESASIVRRFEAERQALAVMDHQGIAKVFDGGSTDDGAPFFVMELVEGVPLTAYCDRENLPVRCRLELFAAVCAAVAHAHAKGVIHRDLKPSNILVATADGAPTARIIDFGVARAVGDDEGPFGRSVVGTPAYMSPEQADPAGDVDTRADVYALGVILREILGDTPPRDLGSIVAKATDRDRERRYPGPAALADDVRRFLAQEPVSARDPSAWYVLTKFLRRYRGPVAAAAAVVMALVGGVVGTTLMYFEAARRAEAEREARGEAESALAREAAQRRFAQGVAGFVRDDFLALASVEGQMRFGGADVVWLTKDTSLTQLLDRAAKKLDERRDLAPTIEAELRWIVGVGYRGRGEPAKAVPFLARALELREEAFGPESPETLAAMNSLAVTHSVLGDDAKALELHRELERRLDAAKVSDEERLAYDFNLAGAVYSAGDPAAALPLLQRSAEATAAKYGPDDADALTASSELGLCLLDLGRTKEAVDMLDGAYRRAARVHGEGHLVSLLLAANRGSALSRAGRHDDAVAALTKVVAARKARLGDDHPFTLSARNDLAVSLVALGDPRKAADVFGEILPVLAARLGPAHPKTLSTRRNLGVALGKTGRAREAVGVLELALAGVRGRRGEKHPETLTVMCDLGTALSLAGDKGRGAKLLDDGLAGLKSAVGPADPRTLEAMGNVAVHLRQSGEAAKAAEVGEERVRLVEARAGEIHEEAATARGELATSYFMAKNSAAAAANWSEAVRRRTALGRRGTADCLKDIGNLAVAFYHVSDYARCLPLAEEFVAKGGAIAEAAVLHKALTGLVPNVKSVVATIDGLRARSRAELEKVNGDPAGRAAVLTETARGMLMVNAGLDAEPLLREALELREKEDAAGPRAADVRVLLGMALAARRRPTEAVPMLLAGFAGLKKHEAVLSAEGKKRLGTAAEKLAECYASLRKPDEAKKWRAESAKYPAKTPSEMK